MHSRRQFVQAIAVGATGSVLHPCGLNCLAFGEGLAEPNPDDDLVSYVRRFSGTVDQTRFNQLLGAANEFKEGDQIVGVAAASPSNRRIARMLLARTRLSDIDAHPPYRDSLYAFVRSTTDNEDSKRTSDWSVGQLKEFLLRRDEQEIKSIMPGLSSDVIGCVVKLMSNDELIAVGSKIFNPLPGSKIGAKGYLGARVQPNSPTDHPEDIRWQVFDAFSYAVGDVLLGTNPVSSVPASVAQVERTLQEILTTFGIENHLPHCVLSHIDVQAEVERRQPGLTALWFQSLGGTDSSNQTFDVSVEKLKRYAADRTGPFGLYFETGQGADCTNGHGHGFDMVLHESRKYGLARGLKQIVAETRFKNGADRDAWVHLNDVAGFIGPEVFRSRDQLVRCCLEDIVMGKLHGLCLGLDVCSTLHMDVSLDDLDWCLEQIMPANPAYLMALPTKIDPMLGYLTTGFHDHVRIREKFGYRVNDAMWKFFQDLEVIDSQGRPTRHFGDPSWVYLQYCRQRKDRRSDDQILAEAEQRMDEVRARGVFLSTGHGRRFYDMEPDLAAHVDHIYADGKESIWVELTDQFVDKIPNNVRVETRSKNRTDYILHPKSGEQLSLDSLARLEQLRHEHRDRFDVQIVISDGLNAYSIMDDGHMLPFLDRLRTGLRAAGFKPAAENIVVRSGRVRAGYRIGETLFADAKGRRAVLHIIGERPGTGHHTFSVYITSAFPDLWSKPGSVDHNITKVVSGIALTALKPEEGADQTARLLQQMS